MLIAWRDPLVTLRLGARPLLLPLSHQLPLIRARYPCYGENLRAIAVEVASKYPDLHAIDIGANIGDTALLLRAAGTFPILCIEGDEEYLPLLERNVTGLDDVEVEPVFVGPDSGELETTRAGGTTRLIPAGTGESGAALTSVASVLDGRPRFRGAKLLKVDTDGFDSRIIASAAEFIGSAKPVVFFEYSPYWSTATGDPEPERVFDAFRALGFGAALVFKNTGELEKGIELDPGVGAELNDALGPHAPDRYYDVCAFHEEDADLYERLRDGRLPS